MGLLRLKIVKATNVKKSDLITKSDPYIAFFNEGKKYTTKVINNNLNPVWNEQFEINLSDTASSCVTFLLYDSDRLTQHDLIASAILQTNSLRQGETVNLELKFYPPEGAGSLFVEATAVDFHGISGEVEKLHQENDKYQHLNNELQATSTELKGEVNKINQENGEYKKLNGELKATSTELKEQVVKFQNKIKILSDELHNLQKTREALDAAVAKSEQQNQKLGEEIGKLHSVEEGLRQFAQKQGADYEKFVNNLTESINKHQQLLKDFAAENEKLKENSKKIDIDSMLSLSNNFQMLDGKVGISIEEFRSYLDMLGPEFEKKIQAKAPQQSLQALFNQLDKDKNGTLNIPELRSFLESTVAQ